MAELCRKASQAVAAGYGILILSDRGVDATHAPIPSLLATAGVHHHLVREGSRTKCGLLVETGDAREVHHVALLIGYGAGAVNPYLAFETLHDLIRQGLLPGRHARSGRQPLHQGAQQGRAQGDVQDGHLHAPELLRRADLRGRRPGSRVRRHVLHLHRLAHRRRRGQGDLGGGRASVTRARSAAGSPARTSSKAAASTSGGGTAKSTCSTRRPCSACSTPPARASTRSSRSTRSWSTTRAAGAPRCAACSASSPPGRRCRSTRSSRWRPSSSASRPARCRTGRSARRRTRRWRSR